MQPSIAWTSSSCGLLHPAVDQHHEQLPTYLAAGWECCWHLPSAAAALLPSLTWSRLHTDSLVCLKMPHGIHQTPLQEVVGVLTALLSPPLPVNPLQDAAEVYLQVLEPT